jgi:methionine-rich copper-binding protein CopC
MTLIKKCLYIFLCLSLIVNPVLTIDFMANNLESNKQIAYGQTVSDSTPPTILYPAPVNGSYNVIIGDPISIKFSEYIQKGDYFSSISLKDSSNNIITIAPSVNRDILTLNPSIILSYDMGYTITIPTGALKDMSGNSFQYGQTVYFRTAQRRATPEITQMYPWPGQNNVLSNETIKLTFNMEIEKGDMFNDISIKDSKNNKVSYTAAIAGRVITLKPSGNGGNFGSGEEFTVTIPYGSVRDKDTKKMINNISQSFAFKTVLENVPPKVKEPTNPQKGAKDIPLDTLITIQFDENIEEGSYYYNNNIILRDEYGRRPSFKSNINNNTLTITPDTNLYPNTIYSLTLLTGTVKDLAGNISEEYTFVFKTGQSSVQEQILPEVVYTNPGNENKYISINTPIAIGFNQGIDVAEENKISLKSGNGDIPISVEARGGEIVIKPINNLNLKYDTKYTVNIPATSIKNTSGSTMKNNYSLSFTTEYENELPRIKNIKPNNNTMDVTSNTIIYVDYFEEIIAGKNLDKITLKDEEGIRVDAYVGIVNGKSLYIYPAAPLKISSKYTVDIPVEAVGTKVYFETKYNKNNYSFSFLTGGDRKDPYIKDVSPESGAQSASIDGIINIVFSENIQKGDNIDKISLKEIEDNKSIGVLSEIKDNVLTIRLKDQLNLAYGKQYTIEIPGGSVKDLAGNNFIEGLAYSFTTSNQNKVLSIKSTYPEKDKNDASIKDSIEIVFNDNVKKGYNFDEISLKDDKGNKINTSLYFEITDLFMDRLVIKPISALKNSTTYTVEIPAGAIKDDSGNILKSPYSLSFTTIQEYTPPKLKSSNPKNGATGVSSSSMITLMFDEKIYQGNSFSSIALKDQIGNLVGSSVTITDEQIAIKPGSALRPGMYYRVEVPEGAVKDLIGNVNNIKYNIDFRILEDKTPPKVVSSSPANGSKNISVNSLIAINFSENIGTGDKFKNIELKDSRGKKVSVSVSIGANKLYIKPRKAFESTSTYALTIPGGAVRDASNNILNGSYILKFTTENPVVAKSTSVSNDNKAIAVTLNQNASKGTNFGRIMLGDSRGNIINIEAKLSGSKLTISPKENLKGGTRYTVLIPSGALKGSQSNETKTDIKVNFTAKR